MTDIIERLVNRYDSPSDDEKVQERISGKVSIKPTLKQKVKYLGFFINSYIDGATVKAVDSNGNVVGSDITDSNGKYSIENNPDNVDEIVVSVENFISNGTSNPLYAGKSVSLDDKTHNVVFDTSKEITTTVNGRTISVIHGGEGTSTNPYQISNLYQLQSINEDRRSEYILTNDIDAEETENWNYGKGFRPIGDSTFNNREESGFYGAFDGRGYEIKGLTINRKYDDYIGLFGYSTGTIENVGLVDTDIKGKKNVGGLIGNSRMSNVRKSYTKGIVKGDKLVGGLVGYSNNSKIEKSYTKIKIQGGTVVGGLVGQYDNSNISNSYATADVYGDKRVGGLIGSTHRGKVRHSYAAGTVNGDEHMAGLIATNSCDEISESYWDKESTGQDDDIAINIQSADTRIHDKGLKTDDMQGNVAESNMKGFDFTNIWITVKNDYPILEWQE